MSDSVNNPPAGRESFDCFINLYRDSLIFIRRGSEDSKTNTNALTQGSLDDGDTSLVRMLYPEMSKFVDFWEAYNYPLVGDRYMVSGGIFERKLHFKISQWYPWGWGIPLPETTIKRK